MGGGNEIGASIALVEIGAHRILVDCGVRMSGDTVLPDFGLLAARGLPAVDAMVQTRMERNRTGPEEWLVVTRRPLTDTRTLEAKASPDATDQDTRSRYHYYLSSTCVSERELEAPSLSELARVIKVGVCIEASFKRGKSEGGMDEYQVRTWQGWHQHMALSLLAVWFLIGETHRGQ